MHNCFHPIYLVLILFIVSCSATQKGITDVKASSSMQDISVLKELGYQPERQILTLSEPLDGKEVSIRTKQTNYGDLVIQAMKRSMPGGEIYVMNSGAMRLDNEINEVVTEYDVLRTFPDGGKLVRMRLVGSVVMEMMKIGTQKNYRKRGFLQHFYNAKLPLDSKRIYEVVLPEYLARGKEANLELLKDHEYYNADEKFVVEGTTLKNDIRDLLIYHMLKIKHY